MNLFATIRRLLGDCGRCAGKLPRRAALVGYSRPSHERCSGVENHVGRRVAQRGAQGRGLVPRTTHSSRLFVSAAIVVAAAIGASDVATARAGVADRAVRVGPHAPHHSLRAAERARRQRALGRQIRRNPRLVLRPGFLKKAALVDFDLPITVRLNPVMDTSGQPAASDDALRLTWDTQTAPWPDLDGAGPLGFAPSPSVTTALTGNFTMQWRFGADTSGYGVLGALETSQGQRIGMHGTPFDISDFDPACPSGPAIGATSSREAGADVAGVSIGAGGTRLGLANLMTGTIQGSLNLRLSFRSTIETACGAPPATTRLIDAAGGGTPTAPLPVPYEGQLKISPAFTSDGRLRLARMVVDESQTPQRATFGYVPACTVPWGPIDDATCAVGDGDGQRFPARVSFSKLTAELIVGDVPG